ncbi:MAG: methylated-DNA--[protein]-cysteine S-methyltransferase [Rickettsiales bacterium]
MQSNSRELFQANIDTPLGKMVAIANESQLLLLLFADQKNLDQKLKSISSTAKIINKRNLVLQETEKQLNQYFNSEREYFDLPLELTGTKFQRNIWKLLTNITYGKVISYAALAKKFGNGQAYRACANANAANNVAIIIPCHRVINSNGNLGGYAGGIDRKNKLLKKEKAISDILCS